MDPEHNGDELKRVPIDDASRLVTWPNGEFLRVAPGEESVALVWSTELSLRALLATVATRSQLSEDKEANVFWKNGEDESVERVGPEEVADLEDHDGQQLNVAQVPFTGFWFTWVRHARIGSPERSEASISYARDKQPEPLTDLIEATATPLARVGAREKLALFATRQLL